MLETAVARGGVADGRPLPVYGPVGSIAVVPVPAKLACADPAAQLPDQSYMPSEQHYRLCEGALGVYYYEPVN